VGAPTGGALTAVEVEGVVGFARARHALWLERGWGRAPEGDDARGADRLRPHRYTNLWRELDRTTVWLFREVQGPAAGDDRELCRRTVAARLFNRRETWEALEGEFGGGARWLRERPDAVSGFLRSRGEPAFTDAYMRCNGLDGVVAAACGLDPVLDELVPALRAGRVRDARRAVGRVYSLGGFLADQLTMDLVWPGGPFPAATATGFSPKWGPGARRGAAHCAATGQGGEAALLRALDEAIPHRWRPRLPDGTPAPFGPRELEHTLCEYAKRVKLAAAEGTGKRPKMRAYRPTPGRGDLLPPGWSPPEAVG
jgi:hypothetical protein